MHDPPPVANAGLGLDLLGRPGSSDLRPSIVAAAHVGVARPSPRGPADRNQSRAAPRPVVQGMRRSIIFSTLVIGAVPLGVAACGSGDDTAGASAAGSSTGIVSVANVGGSDVLADSAGKTLYSAAVEQGGKVHCVDACTSFWDPAPASSADAEKAAQGARRELRRRQAAGRTAAADVRWAAALHVRR
jgi:predicted lipoprotein with Yx(FWY)xxD motif